MTKNESFHLYKSHPLDISFISQRDALNICVQYVESLWFDGWFNE